MKLQPPTLFELPINPAEFGSPKTPKAVSVLPLPHAHMNSCCLFEEGACGPPGVPDVQSRSCAEQKTREPWRINACSNQTGANAA